ncbi:MAG: PIG-L family deacetylase [Clostridia bacterium]|nr:PIG-L family deacetylase [Clostridia bacterium]
MKKALFILLFLLLLSCVPALAEEAPDLTAQCKITVSSQSKRASRMSDRDYLTGFISDKQKNPYIEIAAPKGQPMYGVYVCFGGKLYPWTVETKKNGKWVQVYQSEGEFAHEYAPLPDGETNIRVRLNSNKQAVLAVSELFVFGAGETPSYVQQWQATPEKCDLLVLSGHPDDEILFFGGAIPYYAAERNMQVVVAYLTSGNMSDLIKNDRVTGRRSELLNGLWEMGLRNYPVIYDFWDKFSKNLDSAYEAVGKKKVQEAMVELLRKCKPEVVVTHDVNGEYGHGIHRVCADVMAHCIPVAAEAGNYSDSAQKYGAWQVKKLYLHMYNQNQIEMDWDQPLSAFGGRTGYQVAEAGYQWHVSQHEAGQKNPETGKWEYFIVEPRDSKYSCYRFGLAYTTVGYDVNGNDFFENIPGY